MFYWLIWYFIFSFKIQRQKSNHRSSRTLATIAICALIICGILICLNHIGDGAAVNELRENSTNSTKIGDYSGLDSDFSLCWENCLRKKCLNCHFHYCSSCCSEKWSFHRRSCPPRTLSWRTPRRPRRWTRMKVRLVMRVMKDIAPVGQLQIPGSVSVRQKAAKVYWGAIQMWTWAEPWEKCEVKKWNTGVSLGRRLCLKGCTEKVWS